MATERMFDLAFQYKKARLWKRLYDSEIFAVRLPGGETGYCSVMGMLGEHNALGLYVGDRGFESYRAIAAAAENPFILEWNGYPDWFMSQDCIQCSFEMKEDLQDEELEEVRLYARAHGVFPRGANAYPRFIRYTPNRYPWRVESVEDEENICEALAAAIALAAMLRVRRKAELGIQDVDGDTENIPLLVREGDRFRLDTAPLPAPPPEEYPTPAPMDESTLDALTKLEKRHILECEVIRIGTPVLDENGGAPWFPTLLLCSESEESAILPVPPVERYEEHPERLLRNFVESLTEAGFRPRAVKVRNAATRALLEDFCMKVGVLLTVDEYLPNLDEAREALTARLMNDMNSASGGEEDDDENDENQEEILKAARSLFEQLMTLSDEELKALPDMVLRQFLSMADTGVMPPELEKRLRKLLFP